MHRVEGRGRSLPVHEQVALGLSALFVAATLGLAYDKYQTGYAIPKDALGSETGLNDKPFEEGQQNSLQDEITPQERELYPCPDNTTLDKMQSPATYADGLPVDDTIYYCEDRDGNRVYLPDLH